MPTMQSENSDSNEINTITYVFTLFAALCWIVAHNDQV